ncbi:DUF4439 domain-containing protein [Gordonia amarae]|uniref:DUF4439 domain-containing protein n=2 Tax=Gordonia amarae TaxID=36821 RepID=G7GU26_9ACTN|nr:ferritin-like domain-containing protein [Gordonia amarae]MCS3878708.1 hypothetical protein [Gordonia amarae]QHN17293.1 DUF4439 domain-containing protein [Gordonia amarae]QHN21819.1 DUF4439 domain-containing protein [Gordonia amarae]QHN30669.1 DUF4439 domain-containing protein [Gordonia amarae]QHN39446.1 DUF4439 domain-containing protein [Gordonia amarae]
MSETTDALKVVVASEHAALFTYGVITAFTTSTRRKTVDEFTAAHRAARDTAAEAMRSAGATPPDQEPGYVLPVKVTDPVSAAKVALAAETDSAVAYRSLLEKAGSPAVRQIGLDGLTACASRAAQWRAALKQSPYTVALPGSR